MSSDVNLAFWALVIIPLSPIVRLMATPANINKAIIVTTKAIKVIPIFVLINYFTLYIF